MHEYAKVGYVGWIMMCHNSKLRLYLRAIVSLAANTRYFSFIYMPLFGISKVPVMKYETARSAHRKSLFQTSEWLILIAIKVSPVD